MGVRADSEGDEGRSGGDEGIDVCRVPQVTDGQNSGENASWLMRALERFGAPTEELKISAADFSKPDVVAQLGVPPYRIDILTSISGVDFDAAWGDQTMGEIAGVLVPILGRRAFVINKRAAGRTKDAADLEALGEA